MIFIPDEVFAIGLVLALMLPIGAVLIPLTHWWSRIGLPKIGRTSVCAKCAYDLTGLPNNAACPECGSHARPSLRLSKRSPWWITNAWFFGSLAANIPTFAFALSRGIPIASLVAGTIAYSLVLLGCFHNIARRPNKTAVIVAMLTTLGLEFLTQVFQVLLSWHHHRNMSDLLPSLQTRSILISAGGLATTSLIAILIIAMTPDTDLTPPASP